MDQFPGHKCQLPMSSRTYLPNLLPTASLWQKISRAFHKSLIVSNKHPMTSRFFKSQGAIAREHRRQSKLPYTVIHPCSCFLLFWRIIALGTFIVYIFSRPAYIAFYNRITYTSNFYIATMCITSTLLYIEIVVRLFSGYYDKGNEMFVLCKKQIHRRYLRTTLIPEIISSFPEIILMHLGRNFDPMKSGAMIHVYIVFFMFLFCITSIPKYAGYYRVISVYYDIAARTDLMIKLGICSVYTIHFATLLSLIIPDIGDYFQDNVLAFSDDAYRGEEIPNTNTSDRNDISFIYARTFLWTMQTFIGCGFVNSKETEDIHKKYVYTFTILCGWICVAFFIIILKQSIISHDRSPEMYDSFMYDVKEYCTKLNLSDDLATNIQMYLKYKFRNNYFNEEHIFRTLSSRLRSQITMDQCTRLLEQVDIFKNLPSSMIRNIMSCLKLEIHLPGEFIIKAKEAGKKMYFLETGSAVAVSETGKQLNYYEDGSYFGEIELLLKDTTRTASVIAVEFCETYTLMKTDFCNVIESNEVLLAQMQQIAMKRIQEDDLLGQ